MAHLERPINQMSDEKIFRLFIATITVDGPRMTIEKSKEPVIYSMISMYLSAVGLTCAMMGFVSIMPHFPQVWRLPWVWLFYLGGFAVLTLAKNVQSLPDLLHTETTVLDKAQGTVYWNGEYACQISDVCSVRIWTRLVNGLTRYRVSLIIRDNRAFHLIETTPEDFNEYFRYAWRSSLRPFLWPYTEWEASSSIPTGGDNGGNDQLAFAWLLARFLNVPIA